MFLALNDPHFLSDYRHSTKPIMTLQQFAYFGGCIFIGFTLFLFFFVDENPSAAKEQPPPKDKQNPEVDDTKPLLVRRHSPLTAEDSKPPAAAGEENYSVSQIYHLYFDIMKNPYVH